MGGKIECYLDIASLYSYVAFAQLQDVRDVLTSHSIDVEYHPVFLGAINLGSGNKPPWTLPAKKKYGEYDLRRSLERCGKSEVRPPADFASMSITILPLRALSFIKGSYPKETFEATLHYLFHSYWVPPNINLTEEAKLIRALAEVPVGFRGADVGLSSGPTGTLFSPEDVECIMQAASSREMKDLLRMKTQEALDRGAFGAPWLWVTNSRGVSEPFFGSDRFHFIYKFLGLPYQDVTLFSLENNGNPCNSKL